MLPHIIIFYRDKKQTSEINVWFIRRLSKVVITKTRDQILLITTCIGLEGGDTRLINAKHKIRLFPCVENRLNSIGPYPAPKVSLSVLIKRRVFLAKFVIPGVVRHFRFFFLWFITKFCHVVEKRKTK